MLKTSQLRYLEIDVPDSISVETLSVEALSGNWRAAPEATRQIGDEWVHSGRDLQLF
jgi:hypothetical protein